MFFNENDFNELCCIKCRSENSQYEKLPVVSKGIQKIIEYSEKIKDTVFTEYLKEKQQKKESVKLHRQCQKDIYNELKRKIEVPVIIPAKVAKVSTRLSIGSTFAWKKDCFLCEKPCAIDERHLNRSDCHQVTTLPFKNKVLDVCSKRDDDWGLEVQRKALGCHDFVAVEARYHEACYRNFALGRAKIDSSQQSEAGRPTDETSFYFFNKVCERIEIEGDYKTLQEIHKKMVEMAGSIDNVYTVKC